MSFQINGGEFKGIGVLGGGQPEAGYYAVTVTAVEAKAGDKQDARRLHVEFDNGFKMFDFIHLPVAGLPEKSYRGRLAALKTILSSLGFSNEEIEGGQISDAWFITASNGGRKAHVEFVPGQAGVQGSYARITKFVTKTQFDAAIASGKKPVTETNNTPAPAVPGVIPAAPSAAASAVVTTVPAGAAGVRLPPPPAVSVAR
jgi:hypothetical protein